MSRGPENPRILKVNFVCADRKIAESLGLKTGSCGYFYIKISDRPLKKGGYFFYILPCAFIPHFRESPRTLTMFYGENAYLPSAISAGAIDFLRLPLNGPELLWRIRKNLGLSSSPLKFGPFFLTLTSLQFEKRVEPLTFQEYRLLYLLFFTHEKIIPRQIDSTSRALDMAISRLRRKFQAICEASSLHPEILCDPGNGYIFQFRPQNVDNL
jgi:hypothetical protein